MKRNLIALTAAVAAIGSIGVIPANAGESAKSPTTAPVSLHATPNASGVLAHTSATSADSDIHDVLGGVIADTLTAGPSRHPRPADPLGGPPP